MSNEKLQFLRNGLTQRLKTLPAGTKGKWGKMNAQQMVEHLADFFKVASQKKIFPLVTPEEYLPKFKAFLLSDKEFRENTEAPKQIVPEEPFPGRNDAITAAIDELQKEIDDFVLYFEQHPGSKTTHPVFGELDFNEWVLLHHKHVTHHIKQFGLL